MKEHFTKPGFVEALPKEIQDILPPAKFFHVGDRLCILIAQNGIVYWDVEKGENVPLKSGEGTSPVYLNEQFMSWLPNWARLYGLNPTGAIKAITEDEEYGEPLSKKHFPYVKKG